MLTPEHSENAAGTGRVIMIDANALGSSAKKNETTISKLGGHLISHGAGHNAGAEDLYTPPSPMSSGQATNDYIKLDKGKLDDLYNTKDNYYIGRMKNRFQHGKDKNPHKVNYPTKNKN